jgi:quercetin dioxygenase-like cupin family protein
MARIDEEEFRKQLRRQGFSRVYVWQDAAGAFYPDHIHQVLTAHIILDGEMTLSMRGKAKTYRTGDRCDVSAGAARGADGSGRLPLHDRREMTRRLAGIARLCLRW